MDKEREIKGRWKRELILGVDRQEDRQTRGLEDREQGQMDQEEETGKASQGAEMKDTQIKRGTDKEAKTGSAEVRNRI